MRFHRPSAEQPTRDRTLRPESIQRKRRPFTPPILRQLAARINDRVHPTGLAEPPEPPEKRHFERFFPGAKDKRLPIKDDPNDEYNCIGYAVNERANLDPRGTADAQRRFLIDRGFDPSNDAKHVKGKYKVAVYGKRRPDGSYEPTHAAKEVGEGVWRSKLGKGPLVEHNDLDDISGEQYGYPMWYFEKPENELNPDPPPRTPPKKP